jgi:hypothetical protein
LCFGSDGVVPMAVVRFSTSVAVAIVATTIAVIAAVKARAGRNVAKRIANTNKLPRAAPTTAIVSGTTAIASFKPN